MIEQILNESPVGNTFLFLFFLVGCLRRIPVYEAFIQGLQRFSNSGSDYPLFGGNVCGYQDLEHLERWIFLFSFFTCSGCDRLSLGCFPCYNEAPVRQQCLGLAIELIQIIPDSFIGRLASVMQGTTDTTFFVLTVYFGSVGIRRYRHAVHLGLLADLTGLFASLFICHLMFS